MKFYTVRTIADEQHTDEKQEKNECKPNANQQHSHEKQNKIQPNAYQQHTKENQGRNECKTNVVTAVTKRRKMRVRSTQINNMVMKSRRKF